MYRKSVPFMFLLLTPLLMSVGTSPSGGQARHERYFNKGVDAQKKGRYDDAIRQFRRAIQAKRDYAEAYNMLGYVLRKKASESLEESGEAYATALELNPNFEEALEYQGELFLRLGQLKKAHANYLRLVALKSDEAKELKKKLDDVLKEARELQEG